MPSKRKREIAKIEDKTSQSHIKTSKWRNSKCKSRIHTSWLPRIFSKSLIRRNFLKIIHFNWLKLSSINKSTTSTMAFRLQIQYASNIRWLVRPNIIFDELWSSSHLRGRRWGHTSKITCHGSQRTNPTMVLFATSKIYPILGTTQSKYPHWFSRFPTHWTHKCKTCSAANNNSKNP